VVIPCRNQNQWPTYFCTPTHAAAGSARAARERWAHAERGENRVTGTANQRSAGSHTCPCSWATIISLAPPLPRGSEYVGPLQALLCPTAGLNPCATSHPSLPDLSLRTPSPATLYWRLILQIRSGVHAPRRCSRGRGTDQCALGTVRHAHKSADFGAVSGSRSDSPGALGLMLPSTQHSAGRVFPFGRLAHLVRHH
jgi:hypothetical protein